jgi:hypothetical protein
MRVAPQSVSGLAQKKQVLASQSSMAEAVDESSLAAAA